MRCMGESRQNKCEREGERKSVSAHKARRLLSIIVVVVDVADIVIVTSSPSSSSASFLFVQCSISDQWILCTASLFHSLYFEIYVRNADVVICKRNPIFQGKIAKHLKTCLCAMIFPFSSFSHMDGVHLSQVNILTRVFSFTMLRHTICTNSFNSLAITITESVHQSEHKTAIITTTLK